MRVLHLNSPAKVGWVLARAQRRLGLEATVVLTHSRHWHRRYDVDLTSHDTSTLSGKYGVGRELLRLVQGCDLLHYHGAPVSQGYRDLLLWAVGLGKPVFLHHHGSEVRGKPYPWLANRLSRHRFVSTPDLLSWVPAAEWVPNPVLLEQLPQTPPPGNERPLLVHAPTDREVKNTEAVLAAVAELRQHGVDFDFRLVENCTYQETVKALRQADIVVDWVNPRFGIYGVLSVEAMALGRPVVCTLDPARYTELKPPVVNTSPDELSETLQGLVEDGSRRKRLGLMGRRFVLEHHHPLKAARRTVLAYQRWL